MAGRHPDRQTAAIDAIATAWQARPWPGEGLSSYAVLAGDDGDTLLHYSQTPRLDAPVRQDLTWKSDVDAAVPGINRLGVTACHLRQSTPAHAGLDDVGCLVLVTRVFDGPDLERAERLVHTMFAAGAKTPPAEGMISAHFYVSLDGTEVFNYALWTSAAAHQTAIDNVPKPLADSEEWQHAHAWPGLLTTSFQRFRPRLLMESPASTPSR